MERGHTPPRPLPDIDDIARRAEGLGQHEPDGLGAPQFFAGLGGALIVGFFVAVMVWAVAQGMRG